MINDIKLIIGLGNPEAKYINTRHNIGYKVVDNLISNYCTWPLGADTFFSNHFKANIHIGYKNLVLMAKPITGMNNSGVAVKSIVDELCLSPSNVLVIYDDISLPLGTIRLRESGSSGGHNGVKSIIKELGIEDFNRLKIGIGQPINSSILDWVLSDFTEFEQDKLNKVISFSKDVVTNLLKGVITQGDTFNVIT